VTGADGTAPDGTAYADLLALATDVALGAADLVRRGRADGVEVAATKSSSTDVVTEVDRAAERFLFEALMTARPGDGFLGEEGASSTSTSGVEWVVDPIDGTVNFLYGIPAYAVSVAAAVGDRSVAGVVTNVHTRETYTATLGGGSFRDGTRLRLPDGEPPPLSQRLVGTGFNYVPAVRARQIDAAGALIREVRDLRRIGSAALDLCFVADGRFDAYVEEGLHRWDMAAGGLVATEAGAVLERRVGVGGGDCYVCAPASGFQAFADLVQRCGFLGG
jgi:myo-inositol-1(or 4)-monophosphatase